MILFSSQLYEFCKAFQDVEGYEQDAYQMITCAARYGNQPWSEIMAMTSERLNKFCGSLSKWVERENTPSRKD